MSTSESEALFEQLAIADQRLLNAYPPSEFERRLDATPRFTLYHFKTDDVRNWWHGIRETEGDEAVARYNRLLLLFLMTSFEQRASSKCYPECIIDLFHAEFKRIRRRIKDSELSRFAVNNDLFQKDLGLCRQVLFPVGNSVYEEVGLPRNLLWKGGVWQLLRYSWYLLLVSRGNRPYYGGHVHLDADNFEYSEEQRNLVRLRVAAMMRANPHIKGFMGGGWLYDPALDDISPHLAFGRRLLCANRAWLFYSGLDRTGGALSTSKKRRQLYDEGKYLPRSYLIAWPRKVEPDSLPMSCPRYCSANECRYQSTSWIVCPITYSRSSPIT